MALSGAISNLLLQQNPQQALLGAGAPRRSVKSWRARGQPGRAQSSLQPLRASRAPDARIGVSGHRALRGAAQWSWHCGARNTVVHRQLAYEAAARGRQRAAYFSLKGSVHLTTSVEPACSVAAFRLLLFDLQRLSAQSRLATALPSVHGAGDLQPGGLRSAC